MRGQVLTLALRGIFGVPTELVSKQILSILLQISFLSLSGADYRSEALTVVLRIVRFLFSPAALSCGRLRHKGMEGRESWRRPRENSPARHEECGRGHPRSSYSGEGLEAKRAICKEELQAKEGSRRKENLKLRLARKFSLRLSPFW